MVLRVYMYNFSIAASNTFVNMYYYSSRPDMTFAVDWALKPIIYLSTIIVISRTIFELWHSNYTHDGRLTHDLRILIFMLIPMTFTLTLKTFVMLVLLVFIRTGQNNVRHFVILKNIFTKILTKIKVEEEEEEEEEEEIHPKKVFTS